MLARLPLLLLAIFAFGPQFPYRSLPSNLPPITAENADQLTRIGDLGMGTPGVPVWSPGGDLIAMPSSIGIWVYHPEIWESYLLDAQGYVFAWRPNTFSLYMVNDESNIVAWDVNTWESTIQGFTTLSDVRELTFSPDGGTLAVVSGNRLQIIQYDFALSGLPWDTFTLSMDQTGFDSPHVYAFSPDSQQLAYAAPDSNVYIYDTARSEIQATIVTGHNSTIRSVYYTPDGRFIITAADDGTVRIWNAETLKRHAVIPATSIEALSPDGRWLAAEYRTDKSTEIIIWDIRANREYARLEGGFPVSFSTDSTLFVYADADWENYCQSDIHIVNLSNLQTEVTFPSTQVCSFDGRLTELAFYPTGLFFSQQGTLSIWNPETGRTRIAEHVSEYTVAPYGWSVSTYSLPIFWENDIVWRVIHIGTRTDLHPPTHFPPLDSLGSLAFSPDGKTLATGGTAQNVRRWNIETFGGVFHDIGRPNALAEISVADLAYSPDGRLLASAEIHVSEGPSLIWDAESGQIAAIVSPSERSYQYNAVAFSPDGQSVAYGRLDGKIDIFSVQALLNVDENHPALPVMTLETLDDQVTDLDYSPDGALLASSFWDGTVRIWNAETGAEEHELSGHSGGVSAIDFDPQNPTQLASAGAGGMVRIWNFDTREVTFLSVSGAQATSEPEAFFDVNYSPDGSIIAVISDQNMITLWNASTGAQLVHIPAGFSNWRQYLEFSPDGTLLATVGASSSLVRIWGVQPTGDT